MKRISGVLASYKVVLERNVLILSITSIILGVAGAFSSWFFPILVYKHGGSDLITLIFTASYAIAIIPTLIGGFLSDTLGRKGVILISTLMYLIAFILLLPGHLYGLVLAGILIISYSAMMLPATTSLLGESVGSDRVAMAFSLTRLASTLGVGAGSAVLGYVATYIGLYELILLCVALSGLSLALRSLLRETRRVVSKSSPISVELSKLLRVAASSLRSRDMVLIVIVVVISSLGNGAFSIYLPIYLSEVAGLNNLELGIIFSVSSLVPLIAALIAGVVVDVLGSFRSLIITLALYAILIASIASSTSWELAHENLFMTLLLICTLLSFVSMINQVANSKFLIDITTPEARGTLISALAIPALTSQTISPAFGAIFWKIFPALTILAAAILFLASIPLLRIAWRLRANVSR